MSFQPNKITKDHVLKAFEEIKGQQDRFPVSTKYDVVFERERYSPKTVLRMAHHFATGIHQWDNGGGPATNKYLERFGFEVVKKEHVNHYNWTQTHKELAEFLRDKRDKTPHLLRILEKAGVVVGTDQAEEGVKTKIEEIDPFTFFCYIYKYGEKRRLKILQNIAQQLELSHPDGERGIPSANAQKVWMFPYAYMREGNEFDILWELFEAVINDQITEELFQKALNIHNVGKTELTEVLFYIKPFQYFPINGPSRPYLKDKLQIDFTFNSFEEYQKINLKIKEHSNLTFPEHSYAAWEYIDQVRNGSSNSDLTEGESQFIQVLKRYPQNVSSGYFEVLDRLIQELGLDGNEEQVTYNCSDNKAKFIIGQRTVWDLDNIGQSLNYSVISKSEWGKTVFTYEGKGITSNMVTTSSIDPVQKHLENSIVIARELLVDSKTTGYKKNLNIAFKKSVFELEYRKTMMNKAYDGETGNENYWIFQGSPDIYNLKNALRGGHLKTWKVAAHKDKIKEGDKLIIWQTGVNAGCYALAEVKSTPGAIETPDYELQHYLSEPPPDETLRVRLEVEHYMGDDPILWKEVRDNPALEGLKAGNQGTNFKATKEEFEFFKNYQSKKSHEVMPSRFPLNQILYGPPGTGKTYKLQNEYFERFIKRGKAKTKEDYIKEIVEPLQWWEVYYLALIENADSKVADIINHPVVIAKQELSNINNYRASAWGTLQRHTVDECPNVKVVSRANIRAFWKNENKTWKIHDENDVDIFPEAKELLNSYHNYKPTEGSVIKNHDFVTFHQSFTYEDFVEGIKPVMDEDDNSILRYEIQSGIFSTMCRKARSDSKNAYAIFIDEINRGNVASIFGELITLIESDKRAGAENELSVILPYSKQKFSVPKNLHIIGTMNTADRSIEALDSALRRRFEFEEMMPNYEVIDDKLDYAKVAGIKISDILETINNRITVLLDRDHQIGHSYFIKLKNIENLEEGLKKVFMRKIIPLLQEYFFNDYVKIAMVLGDGFMTKKESKDNLFAIVDDSYAGDYEGVTRYEIIDEKDLVIETAIKILMNQPTTNA
ncbi:MAG: AAA family ATPase [Nonlabens sp.]